jgi:hypothetical protein
MLFRLLLGSTAVVSCLAFAPVHAQTTEEPAYLRDRGPGIRTSLFGTYVRENELLVYPFFEYYRTDNEEGKYRAREFLIFLGYGINDWLAVEFEAAAISATLQSPDEGTIKESGVGDVEGQIRARLLKETVSRPELFTYFEAVLPTQKDKELIGTADWEYKIGAGIAKGFSFGTITLRGAKEYSREDRKWETGELAIEYLKRLSPTWRAGVGLEGNDDAAELIGEVQYHFSDRTYLKLNSAFGVHGDADDWAPEIGVMFSF